MSRTLCFDFGNTRKKAGLFEDGVFIEEFILMDDMEETVQSLLDNLQPDYSILSSVIKHDPKIESLLAGKSRFHKLSHKTKVNFTVPVGKPETVGADRLALCAAAVHFYPGRNNLVIGLGSCITYNFINQYHQFLGGSISPGMSMRFRAMHEFTAFLPLVDADWTFPLTGYDTATNMQSGVLYGMACEIDGMVSKYKEKYRNFNVVLTGGNAAYFAAQLKNGIFADYNFLFKGLYALSELNNQNA